MQEYITTGFDTVLLPSRKSYIVTYQQINSLMEKYPLHENNKLEPRSLKKQRKKQALNYRPISLTSFENIIREIIVVFLKAINLITVKQFGLLSTRSCMANLFSNYHYYYIFTCINYIRTGTRIPANL